MHPGRGCRRAIATFSAASASRASIDSVDVLTRFAKLVPIGSRTRRTETLEESLAQRIAELPMHIPPPDRVSPSPEWQQRFGSRRLAETALQLLDAIPTNNKKIDRLPRFAILRWLDDRGHSAVVVFGPEGTSIGRGTEIPDLLDQYSDHCLFQVRIVGRQALIDIATAFKKTVPALR